jgi:hypothetical protein
MMNLFQHTRFHRRLAGPAILLFTGILAAGILAACAGSSSPSAEELVAQQVTRDIGVTQTFAAALEMATRAVPSNTPTPSPTATEIPPSPTATPLRTPPALPDVFTSPVLAKDVAPQTYIKDTCEYLKARWDPNNSPPGTVVMVIMYHSVTEDYNPLSPTGEQVHHSDVVMALEHAHEVGFRTITTQQLADFLETNTRIPQRSLLIIVDDRKREEYYQTHFIPYLKKYGWTITNAWISAKDTPDYLWKENQKVVSEGWVDVQAHGVVHNVPVSASSSDDFIKSELYGSITAIEKYFGKRPIGYIWPGGGFTQRSVMLAREAGYRVGFTTNPRGPVMFNWIPQAASTSPDHPLWMPEVPAGDPLMTLPRYWSLDAAYRIDDVIGIGKAAAAAAAETRDDELLYYDIACKSKTGPIPTVAP